MKKIDMSLAELKESLKVHQQNKVELLELAEKAANTLLRKSYLEKLELSLAIIQELNQMIADVQENMKAAHIQAVKSDLTQLNLLHHSIKQRMDENASTSSRFHAKEALRLTEELNLALNEEFMSRSGGGVVEYPE